MKAVNIKTIVLSYSFETTPQNDIKKSKILIPLDFLTSHIRAILHFVKASPHNPLNDHEQLQGEITQDQTNLPNICFTTLSQNFRPFYLWPAAFALRPSREKCIKWFVNGIQPSKVYQICHTNVSLQSFSNSF